MEQHHPSTPLKWASDHHQKQNKGKKETSQVSDPNQVKNIIV
jgi:hypothetical protein